jgi:hypothetical protein
MSEVQRGVYFAKGLGLSAIQRLRSKVWYSHDATIHPMLHATNEIPAKNNERADLS